MCVQGLPLWRNSSTAVNNELYKGYRKGNTERKINEILAGCFSSKYSTLVVDVIVSCVES